MDHGVGRQQHQDLFHRGRTVLSAQDKYTRLVTARDEAHIRTPQKELLEVLEQSMFWQVHRAAIVRADAIATANRDRDGKLTLRLKDHEEVLPVSSSFQHRFKGM